MNLKKIIPIIGLGIGTIKYHIFKKRVPTNLMLSVTDRCDSNCKYCSIPQRGKKDLKKEDIFKIIEEFVKLGGSRIALWGGEPLLRNDIGEIVNFCKKKNLLTSLDTNGHLVPDKIDEIKNLDVLVISFDGEEKVHDKNRGKGSYKKVIKAFETACSKLNVWTITVLNKDNLNSIDFILNKAKEYGFFTTWQVIHHQCLSSPCAINMIPSDKEYKEALKLLILRKKEKAPIVNSIKYFQYLYDWKNFKTSLKKEKMKNLPCYAGKLYCNIDTDGKIYPCSMLIDLLPSKNVLKTGFKKAFEYMKDVPCQSCTAGCYIEYNYTYNLNLSVVFNWFKYI